MAWLLIRTTWTLKTFFVGFIIGFLGDFFVQNFWQDIIETSSMQKSTRNLTGRDSQNVINTKLNDDVPTRSDFIYEDDSLARSLKAHVRVLIWVMTSPDNIVKLKAKAVRDTWGKRCNKLLFFSSKDDPQLPAIGLNVTESYENLTDKTRQAFHYIYRHHYNDADWFMKANDDTYVIVENLRYFLSRQNSSEPVYFGHRLNIGEFNSGGCGYVLSKEALRRFGQNASSLCQQKSLYEDVDMGLCMKRLGVRIGETSDPLGRMRFYAFKLEFFLLRDNYNSTDLMEKGRERISNYAISFHKLTPRMMLYTDLYIYHIQRFGIFQCSPNCVPWDNGVP
nr:glycoprotein-N-acetylgalactosamine 3-beta-galactosyltransferase 1-like [Biomphalaria glabrata]